MMKHINTYISEKLVINSNIGKSPKYTCVPETLDDLKRIIKERIDKDYADPYLNDIDTSNITNMSYLFCDFKTLKHIDISKWNINNVTTMISMFQNCENIETIQLPDSADKIISTSGMFKNCILLNSITGFEDWDMSNITHTTDMFYDCRSLKNLNLSNWNIKKIIEATYMFYNCEDLETIGNISDWDLSSIKHLNAIFYGCKKLHDVGDLNKWNVNIPSYSKKLCFFRCPYIKKPKWIGI